MAENGLTRGENDLEVYVMAEIPSNILQADDNLNSFRHGSRLVGNEQRTL